MRISGTARLDNQITFSAQAHSDQVVVDRTCCQQAVQRHTCLTKVAVRHDQNILALTHSRLGAGAQCLKRRAKTAVSGVISCINHDTVKAVLRHGGNRVIFGLRQHRRGQADAASMLR